jgi:type IV secretion system protein VirD4
MFLDPRVQAATSASDFDLRDLRRKKISVYLHVKENDAERLQAFLNLFFSIAISQNTDLLPSQDTSIKHKLLVMMDELPVMGRVDELVRALGYTSGYWVYVSIIAQSRSQLISIYGEHDTETIEKACACKVEYTPASQKDAETLSRQLGNKTVNKRRRSFNIGGRGGGTVSHDEASRALALPSELLEMPEDEEIILITGMRPIKATKIQYFKRDADTFLPRILPPPPVKPINKPNLYKRSNEIGPVRDPSPATNGIERAPYIEMPAQPPKMAAPASPATTGTTSKPVPAGGAQVTVEDAREDFQQYSLKDFPMVTVNPHPPHPSDMDSVYVKHDAAAFLSTLGWQIDDVLD